MRAVATELGTTASALYRYVRSRDELLDLMVDTAMASFDYPAPPGADWLSSLVDISRSTLALYLSQPWLMDVRPASSAPGPHTLLWFEHCLRALAPLDAPTVSKMEAIGVLNGVIMNFARAAATPSAMDFSALEPSRHPLLTAALTNPTRGQPTGDLFERTIRALLTGLLTP